MSELMSDRKDLRRLRIGAVDKDQRRQRVDQCESAELMRVELPMGVASNDPVPHHQDALLLCLLDEAF